MKNLGYKISFSTNTITLTKAFEARASIVGSEEYGVLQQLSKDFPTLNIVRRTTKKSSNSKARTTYAMMEQYILCLDNAESLLVQFVQVKTLAKSQTNPYALTKKWFDATFPDYGKTPRFDKSNRLIVHINENAGIRIMESAEVA